MNTNKALYCTIFFLLMAINSLYGQELKIYRTDVDSSRHSFITATYLFGFDVYIDGIDSCTGVSFDLNYTNSNYVHFSEVRGTEFGIGGKQPVVITRPNVGDNTGYVYCGVLTGDTVGSRGFDNPKVIHLEFAVSQNAVHGLTSVFTFSNVQAVISTGSSGRIIQLEAEPITFDIHGFIDVYPGDANNDGTVDTKDVTTIGRFMGYGSSSKTAMRSFKRPNASTIWAAQPVLAWDSIDVAHSDCDGNGDVTVTDQLIVAINFGKSHTFSKINFNEEIIENEFEINTKLFNELDYKKTAVYINSNSLFIGAAAEIDFSNLGDEIAILGFEKGNAFHNNSEFYSDYNNETKKANISLISTEYEESKKGILCYVYYKSDNSENIENDVKLSSIYGASKNGFVFPLETCLGINDIPQSDLIQIIKTNDNIEFTNNSENIIEAEIYNYIGESIKHLKLNSKSSTLFNDLPEGIYFLIYNNDGINNSLKFYK